MAHGQFCWHDLMTTQPEEGRAFYGALLGWTFQQEDMGEGGPYTMIHDGTQGTGGIVKLSESDGLPSHWMLYVSVGDCDATVAKAKELGGNCTVGPIDIPGTGRFAVLADDQGAFISVIALNNEGPETARPGVNQFCWYSISAADPERAKAFYAGLFGWECTEMSMGGDTRRHVFTRNGAPIAGLNRLDGAPMSHWSTAIGVADLDVTHEKAIGLGATGIVAPMSLGTMGRLSVISDPTGATVSLFQWLG